MCISLGYAEQESISNGRRRHVMVTDPISNIASKKKYLQSETFLCKTHVTKRSVPIGTFTLHFCIGDTQKLTSFKKFHHERVESASGDTNSKKMIQGS